MGTESEKLTRRPYCIWICTVQPGGQVGCAVGSTSTSTSTKCPTCIKCTDCCAATSASQGLLVVVRSGQHNHLNHGKSGSAPWGLDASSRNGTKSRIQMRSIDEARARAASGMQEGDPRQIMWNGRVLRGLAQGQASLDLGKLPTLRVAGPCAVALFSPKSQSQSQSSKASSSLLAVA